MKWMNKREAMSDLQQETVKLILDALLSMDITLHFFVKMATYPWKTHSQAS